jgi:hypothetical protein
MYTKLVELFANRVVERKNMIISIHVGELVLRVLGRVDSWGVFEFCEFFYAFELFLALLCLFGLVYHFSCILLFLWPFLL